MAEVYFCKREATSGIGGEHTVFETDMSRVVSFLKAGYQVIKLEGMLVTGINVTYEEEYEEDV